ncbi:MAG: hypothetical protein AAF449_19340 [Myxococcota bacterium]
MNITKLSGLIAMAMAIPATTYADICKDIEVGGKVTLSKDTTTEGCTATLKKDTVIEGDGVRKITTGKHGLVIKLNGHALALKKVNIDFSGDFAIAVHGNNVATDKVVFENVTLNDLAKIECKQAGARVAAIVWKAKQADINLTAMNAKVRFGVVIGAPMPPGEHKGELKDLGTATISGPIAHCEGKWKYGGQAVFAFERDVKYPGGTVHSVGPCDINLGMPMLLLRDHGLPSLQ